MTESVSEEKLAARLEKVVERLDADAPNMTRPGADLIAHYLDLDRLPVEKRWSRKHAHTQGRLCERFAAPVMIRSPARTSRPGTPGRSSTRPQEVDPFCESCRCGGFFSHWRLRFRLARGCRPPAKLSPC
jgi:hypothetical protein